METLKALELVETSINTLSNNSRTTYVRADIDPVIDNLLELWGLLNEEGTKNALETK